MPPKRAPNRLLVLCASINDVTAWPFWKFLQMKKIKGVTDLAMLAFNSSGGSFEARIDGDKYTLKNYAKVKGYQPEMLDSFLHRWHDPGRSYFVYGGHGMGDYIELEQRKMAIQAHELANIFGKRQFEAIVFDACFMANLDSAYHLRHNTRYIGACEGYMWEPDTCLDYHIFNTHNASALSRFKDPKHILESIQKDYCGKAARGDFSIIDTTHTEKLRAYVQAAVMPRVYSRATFYTASQQERLTQLADAASQEVTRVFGTPGHELAVDGSLMQCNRAPSTCSSSSESVATPHSGRMTRRLKLQNAIQFEHALYPSEAEDKHLVDLRSYLVDMAREEAALRRPLYRRRRFVEPPTVSRTTNVDEHGRFPPEESASSTISQPRPDTTSRSTATAATITTSPPTLDSATSVLSDEAIAALDPMRMSSTQALGLLDRVVVSHCGPQAASIYATRLGGLSLCVHDYSEMSRPVEPWVVQDRTLLNEKSRRFLKRGVLAEVSMNEEVPAPRACSPIRVTTDTDDSVPSASPTHVLPADAQPVLSTPATTIMFDYPPHTTAPPATSSEPAHETWTTYLAQIRDLQARQSGAANGAAAAMESSTTRKESAQRRERESTRADAQADASVPAPVELSTVGHKRGRHGGDHAFLSW